MKLFGVKVALGNQAGAAVRGRVCNQVGKRFSEISSSSLIWSEEGFALVAVSCRGQDCVCLTVIQC